MGLNLTSLGRKVDELIQLLKTIESWELGDAGLGGGGGGRNPTFNAQGIIDQIQELIDAIALIDFATEATLATRATEATLATRASEATAVAIDSNTDPAGGLTIAEWLEDIEADVDSLEAINTNIRTNTGNTAARLILGGNSNAQLLQDVFDELVDVNSELNSIDSELNSIDGRLNILGVDTLAGILLATGLTADRLIDSGDTAAELLSDIEDDTTTIAARLLAGGNSAATLLDTIADQLLGTVGGINPVTISVADSDIVMRPNINQSHKRIGMIEITNSSGTFPHSYTWFRTDGTTEILATLEIPVSVVPLGTTVQFFIDVEVQRDYFLVARRNVTDAEDTARVGFLGLAGSGDLDVTSPT